jgi:hypothetical protein
MISVSDFLYDYVDSNDQSYYKSKYELSSLDENKKYNGLFKHQELVKRVLLFKDRLLLFHKTGTGKSCAAFGSVESFANQMMELINDFVLNYNSTIRGTIKRIYFLTKGPTLVSNSQKELVCSCIPDSSKYITEEVLTSETDRIFRSRLRTEVNKYYTIATYYEFAVTINNSMSDEEIREKFSNCIFVLDEVHSLSTDDASEKIDRRIEELEELENNSEESNEVQEINQLISEVNQLNNEIEDSLMIYDRIFRVFHLIKNSKIILMTATPMIDQPNEINKIMNLILPLDQQLKITNYNNVSIEDLKPYFQGKISYVGSFYDDDIDSTPIYIGEKIKRETIINVNEYMKFDDTYLNETKNGSRVIILENEMSEYQSREYLRTFNQNEGKFYSNERQVLNFAFEEVDRIIRRMGVDRYSFNDQINRNNLKIHSSKIDSIVNLSLNEFGKVFLFSNFVRRGTLLISAALRLFSVEQYTGNIEFEEFTFKSEEKNSDYCRKSKDTVHSSRILLPKKLRFAIITSETQQFYIDKILKLFNSPENRLGEYIKIIIGSPKIQLGISLNSILSIHILEPHWNSSVTYQALSRGIRRGSLDLILQLMREKNLRIKIYFHCAVLNSKIKGSTLDQALYLKSEEKDIAIKRIERFMKILSFDCLLDNKRISSVNDFTQVCDYQGCDYKCYDQESNEVLYDSFDVLYSEDLLKQLISRIKSIFSRINSMSINQLESRLSSNIKFTNKQLLLAIERLIDDKHKVVNRFGVESYFHLVNDQLLLDSSYRIQSDNLNTQFNNNFSNINFFINKFNSLDNLINENIIKSLDSKLKSLDFTLNDLTLDEKSAYLERLYIKRQSIPSELKRFLISVGYPRNAINEMQNYIRFSGRKKINAHIKTLDTLDYTTEEEVVLNTLLINSSGSTSYNVSTRTIIEGLRIYNPKNELKKFYNASFVEILVFNRLLQTKQEKREIKLNPDLQKSKYFGTVSHIDDSFRIVENKNQGEASDQRKISRGKKCLSFDTNELIQILLEFDYLSEDLGKKRVNFTKQQIIDFLIDNGVNRESIINRNLEYLKNFYRLFNNRSKTQLCTEIREVMTENNLIIEI